MSSIKRRINALANGNDSKEVKVILDALLADITAIRTALTTFTAKFDTDAAAQNAAVTSSQLDTNYASTVDPAALTTTSQVNKMAITATSSSAANILRMANGSHIDSSGTTAFSQDVGFNPRYIRVENETDRILFEWYEGTTTANGVKTAAAGTRTLETSGLITVSDNTIGFPVLTSKQYRWVCFG